MHIDNVWDVKVVKADTGDVADRKIHFDEYKIYITPNDVVIRYK
jgi:hypothetical protein